MGKQRKKKKSKASRRGNVQSAPKAGIIHDARVQDNTDKDTSELALQPFGEGPRFTVLMAAYNRADLIHVAIDSVLAQDFEDYELVIVDDGSTDDTPMSSVVIQTQGFAISASLSTRVAHSRATVRFERHAGNLCFGWPTMTSSARAC